jgi:hypothetical protein
VTVAAAGRDAPAAGISVAADTATSTSGALQGVPPLAVAMGPEVLSDAAADGATGIGSMKALIDQ